MAVEHDVGRESVIAHDCEPVGFSMSVAGIAAATNRTTHQVISKNRWDTGPVMENAERAHEIEFGGRVIVDFCVHLVAVEGKGCGDVVVVSCTGQVRIRNERRQLARDGVHSGSGEDVQTLRVGGGITQGVIGVAWRDSELCPSRAVGISRKRVEIWSV